MAYDPFGSGDLGASPFDDIFARFFGGAVPQRPAQRIDIGQLLTEQARELVLRRMAAGAEFLRDLTYTAWIDSAKPVPAVKPIDRTREG